MESIIQAALGAAVVGGVIGALYGLFFGVLGKLFKKIKSKKKEKKVIEKKLVTSAVENDEKSKVESTKQNNLINYPISILIGIIIVGAFQAYGNYLHKTETNKSTQPLEKMDNIVACSFDDWDRDRNKKPLEPYARSARIINLDKGVMSIINTGSVFPIEKNEGGWFSYKTTIGKTTLFFRKNDTELMIRTEKSLEFYNCLRVYI